MRISDSVGLNEPLSGLPLGLLDLENGPRGPSIFDGIDQLPEERRRPVFQARREAYSRTSR